MSTGLISNINESLEISLPATLSLNELKQKLSLHINHLINHDFEKLVSLLYRIDINESKLKQLLQQKQGADAADTIADLIIERQLQKIKSRQEIKKNIDIPDDEKW
jgi:Asp-tRNA(Asn)/Glu-tRNA(Gln) amidotransferase B subunit